MKGDFGKLLALRAEYETPTKSPKIISEPAIQPGINYIKTLMQTLVDQTHWQIHHSQMLMDLLELKRKKDREHVLLNWDMKLSLI